MTWGLGRLARPWSWFADALLLLQFPLLHSALLSKRGGAVLRRLAPSSLGTPLMSTTYALIASVQTGLLFLGWTLNYEALFYAMFALCLAISARLQQQLFADPNPYRVPVPRPVSSTSSHLSTTAKPPSQRQMQRLQRSRTADRRAQPPPDSSGRGTGRVATQSYGSTWRQRQRQMQQPLAAGPGRDHAEQWADTHTSTATAATAPASAPPVSYFQQATVSQAQWLDEDPAGALAAHIIN
eukprot:gene14217-18009_t